MKFSIRDLLWLMVVAALATGWFIDRLAVRRLSNELAMEHDRLDQVQAQERVVRAQAEHSLSVFREALNKAEAGRQTVGDAEQPKSP